MSILIIAEAGVNHNGSLDMALRLCDAAKKAGADAVKFQTFVTERILLRNAPLADYQRANTSSGGSQFDMVKALELNFADFERVKRHCDDIGIEFLSTPDDEESLAFLVQLGIRLIKVGSGEVTNLPYLAKIGAVRKPVILSTGMARLGEIESALDRLESSGAGPVTLLHCTTEYPCPYSDVNLRAMDTLRAAFKRPVGYSDHTEGIEVAIAAAARGAETVEKHFTLDRSLPGPDHRASLDPEALGAMVRGIRIVEACLGTGEKKPAADEARNRNVVRRSIVASRRIRAGETMSEANLTAKRAGGGGIDVALWDFIVGRTAHREYEADDLIVI